MLGQAQSESSQLKKDSANIGSLGSTAKGADEREPRKPAEKPVFKGKAKLNSGNIFEQLPTKQNYDMSVLSTSTASAKRFDGEKKDFGENRERRFPQDHDSANA